VAEVYLPSTLSPLFPGLPRRVELDVTSVGAAIEGLDQQWPGLGDRLREDGGDLRRHIHVYVNGERAVLETHLEDGSRVDVIAAISGG
jgi:sulfur-carrier protein